MAQVQLEEHNPYIDIYNSILTVS